jgi:hypothetical protein
VGIEIGDAVTIRFVENGWASEPERFSLVVPTKNGPDDALNPASVVGAILLGLAGPGAGARYEGPPDPRGRRRIFELQVLEVWPGGASKPQIDEGELNDAA